MIDNLEEKLNQELDNVEKTIKSQPEELILILQAHLYVENIIDEIICSILKRGDILIDSKFTFYQKILIIQASDILKIHLIHVLLRLNKFRNEFSHQLQYSLTEKDIDFLGAPFGETYKKFKLANKKNPKTRLRWIIYTLIAHIKIEANIL